MGYVYLTRVARDDARYVYADGRNDYIIDWGTREHFASLASNMGVPEISDEMFDDADKYGSSDWKMTWDNDLFITDGNNAVFRKHIVGYMEAVDTEDRQGKIANSIEIWNLGLFNGVSYPMLLAASRRVGVDEKRFGVTLTDVHAIVNLADEGGIAQEHNLILKKHVQDSLVVPTLSAARLIAGDDADDYEVLGTAAALMFLVGDDKVLSMLRGTGVRIDSMIYQMNREYFEAVGWEEILRLYIARRDSQLDIANVLSWDVMGSGYSVSVVREMVAEGLDRWDISRALKNGIAPDLAATL